MWSDRRVLITHYLERGSRSDPDVLNLDRWARSARWLPLCDGYVAYMITNIICPAMFYNHSELVALNVNVCLKPMNLTNIMLTF